MCKHATPMGKGGGKGEEEEAKHTDAVGSADKGADMARPSAAAAAAAAAGSPCYMYMYDRM